ncbi:MAG TPA: hypothetical protein PKY59_16980 [Pyrinomonadaceae bacterium]|nr:hypothetical protein [Pyrinomonadaceae bacterium]
MVQNIYTNSFSLLITAEQIPVEKLSIENPAKHLIKAGRKLLVSAKKEYGFGEVAETLAEVQIEDEKKDHLTEIAGWHFQCAIERLETAASNFKRAEDCALSTKYRKFASIQRKKCLRMMKNYRNRNANDSGFFSIQNLSNSFNSLFH